MIQMTEVNTSLGKSSNWTDVPGLTQKDEDIMNDIGYGTIKNTSVRDYLKNISNGYVYGIKEIKCDSGCWTATYMVASYKL